MPGPHPIDLRGNALLSDFRRSGLTQADFCRRRNISLASFRYHFYIKFCSKPAFLPRRRLSRI
jgi:hypothetical protein